MTIIKVKYLFVYKMMVLLDLLATISNKNNIIFDEDDSNIDALISDICVLKNFQNQGIAGHLLDKVFDHLNSNNFIGRVRVNSLSSNVSVIRTYETTYERNINHD